MPKGIHKPCVGDARALSRAVWRPDAQGMNTPGVHITHAPTRPAHRPSTPRLMTPPQAPIHLCRAVCRRAAAREPGRQEAQAGAGGTRCRAAAAAAPSVALLLVPSRDGVGALPAAVARPG
eukprot:364031-Chlamydomonas_euryale.AAC.6